MRLAPGFPCALHLREDVVANLGRYPGREIADSRLTDERGINSIFCTKSLCDCGQRQLDFDPALRVVPVAAVTARAAA